MTTLEFDVRGVPVPQGSVKAFKVGDNIRTTHSNAARLAVWRNDLAKAATTAIDEQHWAKPDAAQVHLDFHLPRPKSHPKWKQARWHTHNTMPDIDKLARAALDALTVAGAWKDDGCVCELVVRKWWVRGHERPGVYVIVHGLSEADARSG